MEQELLFPTKRNKACPEECSCRRNLPDTCSAAVTSVSALCPLVEVHLTMANRATFKQQNSFGPGNPVSEHETYEMKLVGAANVQDVAADETGSSSDANQVAAKKGTSEDEKDMYRMNKVRSYQLRPWRFNRLDVDYIARHKNCNETSASCPSLATVWSWAMLGCWLLLVPFFHSQMEAAPVVSGETPSLRLACAFLCCQWRKWHRWHPLRVGSITGSVNLLRKNGRSRCRTLLDGSR